MKKFARNVLPKPFLHIFYFFLLLFFRKEPRLLPRQLHCAPTMVASTKARKVKDDLPPIKRNNMLAIENMILQAIENKYGADDTATDIDETKQKQKSCSTENEKTVSGDLNEGDYGESLKQDIDDTFFLTQVIQNVI